MIGIARAKDIVMRSRRITGRKACDWGTANDCAPDGDLEVATDALVDEFRDFVTLAERTAKKLVKRYLKMPRSRSKVSVMAGCATRGISVKGSKPAVLSARGCDFAEK